ncbi:DUF3261 domain-containing protein [Achromobacter animicus]|uniref:DUF3261 domain-containing protein n=1 Tax=Achromobacter animicus TaxID=1389935 RepID=UPI00345EF751
MIAFPAPFLSACRAFAATLALLALAACAGAPPLPARDAAFSLPRQLHVVQTSPGAPAVDLLLVVQREDAALRWSLFDPMGVPQARQMLEGGQWRNDGFMRPNTQARDLFAALMFAWTPASELDAAYGSASWRSAPSQAGTAQRLLLDGGKVRWTVTYPADAQSQALSIRTNDDVTWRITPLKEQP